MDLRSSKIALIKAILNIDNEALIKKLSEIVQSAKGNEKDFWLELSDEEKEEINFGLRQIENGQTEDWEEVLKRVS